MSSSCPPSGTRTAAIAVHQPAIVYTWVQAGAPGQVTEYLLKLLVEVCPHERALKAQRARQSPPGRPADRGARPRAAEGRRVWPPCPPARGTGRARPDHAPFAALAGLLAWVFVYPC